jgi:uncharacterized membrane protein
MTTYSKATVQGRPIHPMLVGIPVLLYVGTVLSFLMYAGGRDPRWFQIGLFCNVGAVLAALVTAVPGFIDWAYAIPRGTAAKRTGALHMTANLAALALFVVNLVAHRRYLGDAFDGRIQPLGVLDPFLPLSLTVSGIALVVIAGTLGYRLVHKYHVADAPTPGHGPSRPGPGSARPIRH